MLQRVNRPIAFVAAIGIGVALSYLPWNPGESSLQPDGGSSVRSPLRASSIQSVPPDREQQTPHSSTEAVFPLSDSDVKSILEPVVSNEELLDPDASANYHYSQEGTIDLGSPIHPDDPQTNRASLSRVPVDIGPPMTP